MTRVLRLTLLAPDIVEAILDGTQGPEVTLAGVLQPFPTEWTEQRVHFAKFAEAAAYDRRGNRPSGALFVGCCGTDELENADLPDLSRKREISTDARAAFVRKGGKCEFSAAANSMHGSGKS